MPDSPALSGFRERFQGGDLGQLDQDAVRGAYGPAKYDRLVALKRTWDPDNLFRRNQNIRP